MSREYQTGSAVYAKPDKKKYREKYDTRQDAYRLYQHDRPSRQDAHYNSNHVYDNRRPVAQQDHHNAHLAYDHRQYGELGARYVAQQDHEGRYAAAAQKDHYNHQYGQVQGHDQHGRFISDNRKYPVQPVFHHDMGPPGAPHPHHHPHQYKDYSRNPLQELFKPPEGHKKLHAADVHAEAGADNAEEKYPDVPEPPVPPEPDEEDADDQQRRKPRKVREYRIRKHRGGDDKKDESEERDKDDRRRDKDKKDRRRKDKKDKKKEPETSPHDNWYTKTHPAKYIKLGDITYVRAKAYDKNFERFIGAIEGFGFVIIGMLYKGGDAILKIVAPVAAIRSYTQLLQPVLQGVVLGVTKGVAGK